MGNDIQFKTFKPANELLAFVESFWMLGNFSGADKEIVVLPDGRVDVFFMYAPNTKSFHTVLMGLEVAPKTMILQAKTLIYAISFKLLAVEYLLGDSISDVLNKAKALPDDFWSFSKKDFSNFDSFCTKATTKITERIPASIDERKRNLFKLIYASNGTFLVNDLSKQVFWSSRQINRYFNQTFGLPLKTYCTILRFRASFEHIKRGRLFPEQNFADQAHFIKEVKKLSGVIPKELKQNQNDRFIQFSTLLIK